MAFGNWRVVAPSLLLSFVSSFSLDYHDDRSIITLEVSALDGLNTTLDAATLNWLAWRYGVTVVQGSTLKKKKVDVRHARQGGTAYLTDREIQSYFLYFISGMRYWNNDVCSMHDGTA